MNAGDCLYIWRDGDGLRAVSDPFEAPSGQPFAIFERAERDVLYVDEHGKQRLILKAKEQQK